jgi:hypothetical protein
VRFMMVMIVLIMLLKVLHDCANPRQGVAELQRCGPDANEFRARGGKLYYRKGAWLEVKQWPPLHRFEQWETCRKNGLRDIPAKFGFGGNRKAYYLACLDVMQGKSPAYAKVLLEQFDSEGAEKQAAVDSLIEAFGPDKRETAIFLGKLCTLWVNEEHRPSMWFAMFANEIFSKYNVETGRRLITEIDYTDFDARAFVAWLRQGAGEPDKQAFADFTKTPLYKTFVRVLASATTSSLVGAYVGPQVFSVMEYTSLGELMAHMADLIHQSLSSIRSYFVEGKVSPFLHTFSSLEAEIDKKLQTTLPKRTSKEYDGKRKELLIELEVLMSSLAEMTKDNTELSIRHTKLASRVEAIQKATLKSQLGICPVSVFFAGKAGSSKSSAARSVMNYAVTQRGLPTGTRPEQVIVSHRQGTNKHMDGLDDEFENVKGFNWDDFQQNTSDPTVTHIEADMFHKMMSYEKVALPFASLEQKAKSTQLQPEFLFVSTNRPNGFINVDGFDRKSLCRRVDLFVRVTNLTERPFSVTRPPGRYDTNFDFFTLDLVEESDPLFTMFRFELEDVDGKWYSSTKDRVQMVRLVGRFAVKMAKANAAYLESMVSEELCGASGQTMYNHFGEKCCGECTLRFEGATSSDGNGGRATSEAVPGDPDPSMPVKQPQKGKGKVEKQSGADEEAPVADWFRGCLVALLLAVCWYFSPLILSAFVSMIVLYLGLTPTQGWTKYRVVIGNCILPYVCRYTCLRLLNFVGVLPEKGSVWLKTHYHHGRGLVENALRWWAGYEWTEIEKKLKKALLGFGAVLAAYALYKSLRKEKQEASAQACIVPRRPVCSALDVADNEDLGEYINERDRISRQLRRKVQISGRLDQVKTLVAGASAHVVICDVPDGRMVGGALLTQRFAITAGHVIEDRCVNFIPDIQTGNPAQPQHLLHTHLPGMHSVVRPAGRDVCVVEYSGGLRRDLRSHFLPWADVIHFVGSAWIFAPPHREAAPEWYPVVVKQVRDYRFGGELAPYGVEYTLPFATYKGLCGRFIVGVASGGLGFVLGVHHAGVGNVGYAQHVCVEDFELAEEGASPAAVSAAHVLGIEAQSGVTMTAIEILQEGKPGLSVTDPLPDLLPQRLDKPTSTLQIPGFCLGTMDTRTFRQYSKLRPSKLAEKFPEGGPDHFGVAWFKDQKQEDGTWKGPFQSLGDRPLKPKNIDPVAAQKAFEDLCLDTEIFSDELQHIAPISLHQALNGIPGVFKSVDPTKACGWPHQGTKGDHMYGEPGSYSLKPEIMKDLQDFVDGDVPGVVAKGCMKDEVRSISKCASTRWFFSLPFWLLLLFKMFIQCLFLVWRKRRVMSECWVGTNAAGKDWTLLGHALDEEKGEPWSYFAFDFIKYDKSFASVIKDLIHKYIQRMAAAAKFTIAQLGVVAKLLGVMKHVFCIIVVEVFYITDWNWSGDPITVEINTLGQRFLARYWFFKMLPDKNVGDFRLFVLLVAYGDDGMIRCKKMKELTMLTFAECCADWDFEVGSAIKGEALTAESKREDLTFLKRQVVFDEDFDGYRAPLERKSIFKMLCWFDPSSSISEDTWCVSVLQNAEREWFLHGREVFEIEVGRLQMAAVELGIPYSHGQFVDHMESYRRGDFTTWDL